MPEPNAPDRATARLRRLVFAPRETLVPGGVLLLAGLAVLYTFYFAAVIIVPVVAALLLHQLLYAPVSRLHRHGIPLGVSAALVLVGFLGLIGFGVHFLAEPAEQWLREAPTSIDEFSREIRTTAGTLEELRELGEEIDELADMANNDPSVPTVRIQAPGHLQAITGALPIVAAGTLMAFFTAFFLLAQGDGLARHVVSLGTTRQARRRISNTLRGVRDQISTYLVTVTLINTALGVAVALVMWLLGVEHPVLWGVLAGLLNFAPYLGPVVNAFILAVVGFTSFDSVGEALAVPGAYLILNATEGMLITPMILGRRVMMGSLVVFLAVVFWGWLWGPVGALMAVPITASAQVIWKAWRDQDPFDQLVLPPETVPARPRTS